MADRPRKKAKLSGHPRINRISRVDSSGAKTRMADSDGPKFQAGMIRHVSLVNFMNHAKLELKLEPSVNILTGKNGAGKSSIIQGIVLTLGGSAKDTKRGDHLTDFIKRDATKAEIRVQLDNSGEEAYRPEKYGSLIILERVIYRAGGNSINVLKDENGRELYKGAKATEEKARIRKHFFIDLENPLTILQQEEAKVFFQDSTPSSLYNQVMRATFLSNALSLYSSASAEFDAIAESIRLNKKLVEDKESELDKLSKMLVLAEGESDEEESKAQIDLEKKWYYVRSQEKKLAEETKALPGAEQKVARLQQQLDRDQAEVDDETRELERATMALSQARELSNCLSEERDGVKKRLGESTRALSSSLASLDDIRRRQMQLSCEVQTTQQDIRTEKLKSESQKAELDVELKTVEESILELNREKADHEKREIDLKTKQSELDIEVRNLGKNIDENTRKIRVLEQELNKYKDDLGHATNTSSDLHRFGKDVAKLAEAVQKENCFRKRPIGPIGRHINLTGAALDNDDLRALIEAQLGWPFLSSFLVDNDEDFGHLQRLMGLHFRNKRKPDVYKCRFSGSRVDISSGRVASRKDMPVVLDFLTFSDDDVFNQVVETKNVESILVVSDRQAQSLFETAANVPKNASSAITPTFYRYLPASARQTYSSFYIDRPRGPSLLTSDTQSFRATVEQHIEAVTRQIEQATANVKHSEAERSKLRGDGAAIERELKKCSEAADKVLRSLTTHQFRRAELTRQDKRDVEALQKELSRLQAEQEEVGRKKTLLVQERQRLNDKVKADQASLKEAEEKLETSKEKEQEPEEQCSQFSGLVKRKSASLAKLRARKEREEESLEKLKAGLDKRQRNAAALRKLALEMNNGKEMETTRSLKDIAAFEAEQERVRAERLKSIGHSREELEDQCLQVRSEVTTMRTRVLESTVNFELAEEMNRRRRACFLEMRNRVVREISRRFAISFEPYKGSMMGKLHFNHMDKTLKVEVSHQSNDDDEADPTALPLASLSGGERSKTLCSLLLALWEHVWTPFRCLDEWDVYLDAVVRPDIERMLYKHGKESQLQYIFISPQGCSIRGANVIEIEKKTSSN